MAEGVVPFNGGPFRIGFGYDIHRLVPCERYPGRKLIVGGVEVPSSLVLEGHSDADVLLHAITDGVLGALAWGDIGQWFPNTDERYRNISSAELFSTVWQKARSEGWSLGNCDATLLSESPKLSPHYQAMRTRIAELFAAGATQVSVKATTCEKLGAIGRGEGMVAQAVVLLVHGAA